MPLKNKKDVGEIEEEILEGIDIKYVQDAEEVFREVIPWKVYKVEHFIYIIKVNCLCFAWL